MKWEKIVYSDNEIESIMNDEFSIEPSGIAGTYTSSYKEMLSLIEAEGGESVLVQRATNASHGCYGRALYALVGLKLMGSRRFNEACTELSAVDSVVVFGRGGCCFVATPVRDVVEYIKQL